MSIFKRFSSRDTFSNKETESPVAVKNSGPLAKKAPTDERILPTMVPTSDDIAQSIRDALDADSPDISDDIKGEAAQGNLADKYMGTHLGASASGSGQAALPPFDSDDELEKLRAEMEGKALSYENQASKTPTHDDDTPRAVVTIDALDDFPSETWASTYADLEATEENSLEIPSDIFAGEDDDEVTEDEVLDAEAAEIEEDEIEDSETEEEQDAEDLYAEDLHTGASGTESRSGIAALDETVPVGRSRDFFDIPSKSHAEGMNLSELRLDIVRIVSDIESGEALYRRAQQRVDSLVGFIEQAEVAVSILKRLEPENRRLRSENRSYETDVEAANYKLARLEGDIAERTQEAESARTKLETLRAQLIELKAALAERTRETEELTSANEDLKIQSERIQTNLDIEIRETRTLREKHTDLTTRVEILTSEKLNLEKDIETYKLDLSSLRGQNGSLEIENSELRLNLRNVERQNTEMRDDLIDIQGKIVSYKSQHEVTIHRREDKISALQARLEELEQTLKHKEEILQSAVLDISELRKTNTRNDIERERLEKTIKSQNYQISKAEEKLLRSKGEMLELDQRYKHVAEHLAMQRLRQKAPENNNPDIKPEQSETDADANSIEKSEDAFLAHYRAKTP